MKAKLELNDWSYNAGLIGFLRIMEKYQKDALVVQDNYVEFDTEILKNFTNTISNICLKHMI